MKPYFHRILRCFPSLDYMVGQMIMTGFHGNGGDRAPDDFATVLRQIKAGTIGGVILFDVDVAGGHKDDIFSSNIQNMKQLQQLTNKLQCAADGRLLIAVDQEGGLVQRLKPEHGFASSPSAAELAKTPSAIYDTAYALGTRLRALGINVNFAPVADVNVNPLCPIIGRRNRAFSSDARAVAQMAGDFGRGLGAAGVAYSFKHFPGHGSSTTDSHKNITDITNTWCRTELIPYQKLLPSNPRGAMVMVGHLINRNLDSVPASLSARTIGMLRSMGFRGVVVSDDLNMGAIANEYGLQQTILMALNAGNDLLVFGNNLTFDANIGDTVHDIIMNLVHNGQITRKRIRQSYRRIQRLKRHIHLSC